MILCIPFKGGFHSNHVSSADKSDGGAERFEAYYKFSEASGNSSVLSHGILIALPAFIGLLKDKLWSDGASAPFHLIGVDL